MIEVYPEPITRAELAAAAGMEPSSGTFSTYLSDLRRNGLTVEYNNGVVAAAVMFMESTR